MKVNGNIVFFVGFVFVSWGFELCGMDRASYVALIEKLVIR